MIEINGQHGGGQVLRSALSLAMVTGAPFRMMNIRGRRPKPGLMRQHLTCVLAAAEVCGAEVAGARLHSTELVFEPRGIRPGDYHFAIGTAGSTTLLFQTLLPALMMASEESSLVLEGGTHNPMAPSADYLKNVFLPAVAHLGVSADVGCEKVGFAPTGGGRLRAVVRPSCLRPSSFLERGGLVRKSFHAQVLNLSGEIMQREVKSAQKRLQWSDVEIVLEQLKGCDGVGNMLSIQLDYEHISERISVLGRHGLSAENVARVAVMEIRRFLASDAAVGEHLADQLLLPMALAGGGKLKILEMNDHIRTNLEVISQFLDVVTEISGDVISVSQRG